MTINKITPVVTPEVAPVEVANLVVSEPVPAASLIEENIAAVEVPGIPVPQVTNVNVVTANDMFTFSGTALPNQEVVVYVHSDQALIYRAKANAQGIWTINHSQDVVELTPGEHSIYAVAIDTGAKIKSRPSIVSTFTVNRNWLVAAFNRLNLQTTIVTLVVLSLTIFWLYRLKRNVTEVI